MTINILRGRSAKSKAKDNVPPPVSIGEPDAHVFNCPKCSRPLNDGTPRCPGCGQRLILGVTVRRASILMGFGMIVGIFAGGAIASGVITGLVTTATAAVAGTVSVPMATAVPSAVPSAIPAVTPIPVVPVAGPPSAAISALTQTALLDSRIAADATVLQEALASNASANEIARALRSLASDAANGTAQVTFLRSWPEAEALAVLRDTFYTTVSNQAHDALQTTVSNQKAYRAAAKDMLQVLAGLVALDTASRELASGIDVTLPTVDFGALAPR